MLSYTSIARQRNATTPAIRCLEITFSVGIWRWSASPHRIVFRSCDVRVEANVPCAMCERCPKLILYLYLIVHVTGYLAWDKISLINSSTVYLHAPNDRDMGFTFVPLILYNIVGNTSNGSVDGHRRSADERRWIKVASMSITFHRVHTIGQY